MLPTSLPLRLALLHLAIWGSAAASALAAEPVAFEPAQLEFFEKKVRPLLVEHCHSCHAIDEPKGGLRVDSRAAILGGGDSGPAAVMGKPDDSLLVEAVRFSPDGYQMPPKGKLPAEAIQVFEEWVKLGLPWPQEEAVATHKKEFNLEERAKHWSFQPLAPGELPAVKQADWPQSPLDRYILAKLEHANLAPAAPADKRTLLRRVTFDLTGLPPTPQEVADFLGDNSPEAFAKVVERLLASPRYGERYARHWLDLVRYAETHGHEFDFEIAEAYRYRDYVIRAFNLDLPYDQFVIEQIAGDLLPQPRRHPTEGYNESIIGTGFFYLGEAKHSPVDLLGDEADRFDNQIDVFSKTFLGLTVSCARCHDHKFDAIRTKDYYSLAGYLQSSRYQLAYIDDRTAAEAEIAAVAAMNREAQALALKTLGPMLERPAEAVAESIGLARLSMAATEGEAPAAGNPPPARVSNWVQAMKNALASRQPGWVKPLVSLLTDVQFDDEAAFIRRKADVARQLARPESEPGVVFADFEKPELPGWFFTGEAFGKGPTTEAVAIIGELAERPIARIVPPGVVHSGQVDGHLQGVLRSPTFTIQDRTIQYLVAGRGARVNLILDSLQLIRDPIYGGLTFQVNHGEQYTWHVQDVSMWIGHKAYIELIDDGEGYLSLAEVRFSNDRPPAVTNAILSGLLASPEVKSSQQLASQFGRLYTEVCRSWQRGELNQRPDVRERIEVLNWLLEQGLLDISPGEAQAESEALQKLLAERSQRARRIPRSRRASAMVDGTPEEESVFIRGNPKNKGEVVPRHFLEVLSGLTAYPGDPADERGSGRLALAKRLVSPANPLAARVLVNRLWHHHFGAGLVRSVDDFGVMGQAPSHPELLDYLAGEFIRGGYSIKAMHRMLLLSSTYQMASRAEPAAETADPTNRLLHRMPIRRLEAESIRDAMLAISGRLDTRMYGPSVMPHLTPFMNGRGRPGNSGPLDGDGRRSIYIGVRRNFLTPFFLAFDYPQPFTTMGRRSTSNVPAQALSLLNNPLVGEQAALWAKRVLATPGSDDAGRVTRMYQEAFARPPREAELAAALAYLAKTRAQSGVDEQAAYADLAHVLFNVKEFVFVN